MARSGIIYGGTGSYKTTAVAHFARWIARKTGKSTLLFSSDNGGWEPCQEEISVGMIRPFRCDADIIPLPMIRTISRGYWPANPEEPDISRIDFLPVNWGEVGGIAIEGITSLGTMLMRHLADKNMKVGQEGVSAFSQPIRVNGEVRHETFAQSSRAHFGFVQNQLYSIITNFTSLPTLYTLFTGHEKKYTEDGELQCGIATPGKAITPLVPTWVGDCIHAQDYKVVEQVHIEDKSKPEGFTTEDTVRIKCRYYFTKHPDPATGAIFDAKPRVTHSKAIALERMFPGGFFVPTPDAGFDLYLDAVDKLAQDAAQSDSLRNWRQRTDAKLRPPRTLGPATAPTTESTAAATPAAAPTAAPIQPSSQGVAAVGK